MPDYAALIVLSLVTPKEYSLLCRYFIPKRISASLEPAVLRKIDDEEGREEYESVAATLCSWHGRDTPTDIRIAIRAYLKGRIALMLMDALVPALLKGKSILAALRDPQHNKSSRQYAAFLGLFALSYRTLLRLFTHLHQQLVVRSKRLQSVASSRPSLDDDSQPTTGWRSTSPVRTGRVAAEKLQKHLTKVTLSDALPPFLTAALTSGPLLVLVGKRERRVGTAVYALTRAAQFGWDALAQSGWVWDSEEHKWWFGSWLLFPLSSAQLLHAYVYDYDCFPQSYGKFIENRSAAYLPKPLLGYAAPGEPRWPDSRQIIDSLRLLTLNKTAPYPSLTSALIRPSAELLPAAYSSALSQPSSNPLAASSVVLATAHAEHNRAVCALLHPGDPSCRSTFWRYFATEWLSAFKFMTVIYTLSLSLQWRKLIKRPEQTILRAVSNTLKGATFISGAIGIAWTSICFFQRILPRKFMPTSRFYLSGFLAGLVILLDRGRAQELGLFSLRLALVSAWAVAVKRRRVKSIPHGESIYFSLASGIIMALYECSPSTINSNFSLALLKNVVGPRKR